MPHVARAQGVAGYGTPRVSLPDFPTALAPTHTTTGAAWAQLLATTPVLEALPDGRVMSGLAVSRTLDQRRARLDLGIRIDALFSDATPVTPADIAASIIAAGERYAGTVEAWRWENIDSVTAIGDSVVTIVLSQPDASIPALLSSCWVPVYPAAWLERGWDSVAGPFPPASGCFQLDHATGDVLRFSRNRGFFEVGRPNLAGVSCRAPSDTLSRTTSLVTGDVDILVDVPLLDVPTLREDPCISLVGGPSNRLCALVVNLQQPIVSEARVRRLLSMAIDRESLVNGATANEAVPASTLIPTDHWAGIDYTIDPVDPAEVRSRLAALGEPPGLELRLVASDTDASLANACVLIQEQLAWAGIAISLDLLDEEAMAAEMEAGRWDLLLTHTAHWRDPHELVRPLITSDGTLNRGGYGNGRVDYLAGLAARAGSATYRAGFYGTIQQIVASDVPVIPLYFPNYYDAMAITIEHYPFLPPISATAMCQATMRRPDPSHVP